MRDEDEGWPKWVEGVKMFKIRAIKISHGDMMYSMLTVVNNTVLPI